MAYFTYYGMQNLRPVVAVFGEVGPESIGVAGVVLASDSREDVVSVVRLVRLGLGLPSRETGLVLKEPDSP